MSGHPFRALSKLVAPLWVIACLLVAVPANAQGDPTYLLTIPSAGGQVGETLQLSVTLDTTPDAKALSGWSWGVCHPEGIEPFNVGDGSTTSALEPEFDFPASFPDEGWVVGVVIDFEGFETLPPGQGYELHTVEYDLLEEGSFSLFFCNTVSDPPVITHLTDENGAGVFPSTDAGTVFVGDIPFVRGDCNSDGFLGLPDAITNLNMTILGMEMPPCPGACDTNGNHRLEMADAIHLLSYLYTDGPAPAAPFPACGIDPGAPCDPDVGICP